MCFRRVKLGVLLLLLAAAGAAAAVPIVSNQSGDGGGRFVQSRPPAQDHESARSDKLTGGVIERAKFAEGESDVEITVNVPAFQLTLWQNGNEVRTYPIGVGLKDHPIVIGEREAKEIIWNPSWIPPDSEWVYEMKGITPLEEIKADDPRNPLGKIKIPLGGGYLIHQARGVGDLGNLVSHGCIRMLQPDLYDLAEKIAAAYAWPAAKKEIARAKRGSRTVVAALDEPLPVDINYDTEVVEEGVLYLYPDIYERGTNTVERLREELESAGVDTTQLSEKTLRRMLARTSRTHAYAVSLKSIIAGRALTAGRRVPLGGRQTQIERKIGPRRRAVSG